MRRLLFLLFPLALFIVQCSPESLTREVVVTHIVKEVEERWITMPAEATRLVTFVQEKEATRHISSVPDRVPIKWNTYKSSYGYSIQYPDSWFAAQNPGVYDGDILYEQENFYSLSLGTRDETTSHLASSFVIGIQKLSLAALNLESNATYNDIGDAIDGKSVVIIEEQPIKAGNVYGFLRFKEVQRIERASAFFRHGDAVYVIESALSSNENSERIELFKQIVATIRF